MCSGEGSALLCIHLSDNLIIMPYSLDQMPLLIRHLSRIVAAPKEVLNET